MSCAVVLGNINLYRAIFTCLPPDHIFRVARTCKQLNAHCGSWQRFVFDSSRRFEVIQKCLDRAQAPLTALAFLRCSLSEDNVKCLFALPALKHLDFSHSRFEHVVANRHGRRPVSQEREVQELIAEKGQKLLTLSFEGTNALSIKGITDIVKGCPELQHLNVKRGIRSVAVVSDYKGQLHVGALTIVGLDDETLAALKKTW